MARRKRTNFKFTTLLLAAGVLVLGYLLIGPALKPAPSQSAFALGLFEQWQKARVNAPPLRLVARLTFSPDENPQAHRVILEQSGANRKIKYESGPLAGRTLLQSGEDFWEQLPRGAFKQLAAGTEHAAPLATWLQENYLIEAGAPTTLAGRTARCLTFRPRNLLRPSARVWLDETTNLPLKTQRYDSDGRLVYVFEVLKFELLQQPVKFAGSRNISAGPEAVPVAPDQLETRLAFRPYLPGQPPEGFHLIGVYYRKSAAGGGRAEWRYSDGFSLLTLYEMKRAAGTSESSEPFSGRTLVAQVIVVEKPDTQLVAVGELPPQVLLGFAEGARRATARP